MSDPAIFQFRLFVAGDALNSAQALANLDALCRTHLAGHYAVEVVDVLEQPLRALAEAVFLTPTLIKLAPLPVRRLVGSLNQTARVLDALGIVDGHG